MRDVTDLTAHEGDVRERGTCKRTVVRESGEDLLALEGLPSLLVLRADVHLSPSALGYLSMAVVWLLAGSTGVTDSMQVHLSYPRCSSHG